MYPKFRTITDRGGPVGYPLSERVRLRFDNIERFISTLRTADAKERIRVALNRAPPGKNFTASYAAGDYVDTFDTKTKRWSGPYRILAPHLHKVNQLYILSGNRALLRSVDNTRPHTYSHEETSNMAYFADTVSDLFGAACDQLHGAFVTTVPADEATGEKWIKADQEEVSGLVERGVLTPATAAEVAASNAVFVPSKVVRVVKACGRHKSRWVASELRGQSERVVERTVPTPSRSIARLLISYALSHALLVRLFDIKQ